MILRFLFLLLIATNIYGIHTVCIIIHGTWGAYSNWHQPDGDFFIELKKNPYAQDIHILSFNWSGRNNNKSRLKAAHELKEFIQQYHLTTKIIIVAHSHGANVAILASQLLAADPNNKHTIERLYTLGVPVSIKDYYPDMNIIKYMYHFFSFKDIVQPVFGIFERQFPVHERIANIRLIINNNEPDHSGLHSPIVAQWILAIHDELSKAHIGKFEEFIFQKPALLYLYSDNTPLYTIDTARKAYLRQDHIKMIRMRKKLIAHYRLQAFAPSIHDQVPH